MAADEPSAAVTALELLEIAPSGAALASDVAKYLSRLLRLPIRLRMPQPSVPLLELPGRDQADADHLLEALEALDGRRGHVIVGLTGRDIGHPIFTHFFGRARHDGRAVLVSAARLDPAFYGLPEDRGLTIRRVAREVLHELGHVGGLGHCRDWACVMRFAATVEDLDNRGTTWCLRCLAALPAELAEAASRPS